MDNLNDYFSKYIVRQDRTMKAVCAPLCDHLGISAFTYGRIEKDGSFINLANCPKELEIYYTSQLYLNDPLLSHPHLLQSGFLLIPTTFYPDYMQTICTQAKLGHLLLIFQCYEEYNEAFFFGVQAKTVEERNSINLFPRLDLLYSFTRYFKREAHALIERARKEACNVKKIKGKVLFESTPFTPLANQDAKAKLFLKAILPLSPRERQCLELYKQGKTAQNTGAILGLSERTVESYFESIRTKLNCHSKRDLLEF